MRLSFSLALSGLAFFGFLCFSPQAAEAKVGYVHVKKALSYLKDGKEAKKRLQAAKARFQQQLNRIQDDLKKQKQAYDEKQDKLSPEEKRAAQIKLQRSLSALQQYYGGFSKQLMQMEAQETQRIIKKLLPIVEALRVKHKLDAILEFDEARILAADSKLDFTRQVICEYNKKHGGDTAICKQKSLPKDKPKEEKPVDPFGVDFQ